MRPRAKDYVWMIEALNPDDPCDKWGVLGEYGLTRKEAKEIVEEHFEKWGDLGYIYRIVKYAPTTRPAAR